MERVVYEFGYNIHFVDFIPVVFGIIISTLLLVLTSSLKKHQRYLIRIVVVVVMALVILVVFIIPITHYYSIKDGNTTNIQCTQGYLVYISRSSTYYWNHGSDTFIIGDVCFYVSGDEKYGYCKLYNDDKAILKEGQLYKVDYFFDKLRSYYIIYRIIAVEQNVN